MSNLKSWIGWKCWSDQNGTNQYLKLFKFMIYIIMQIMNKHNIKCDMIADVRSIMYKTRVTTPFVWSIKIK